MENKLLEAFNEMEHTSYNSVAEIKAAGYSRADIFTAYLEYEGIIGYAAEILRMLEIIDQA